ncbi:MAG: alpha/beta hydrolase [Propionibacteriaceae bacterium]|jgi:pimeloyl-ACP methyl ester carboxylesterase|nr:alpha/beta hydrolase [Propionibacteriaceae bacterium]
MFSVAASDGVVTRVVEQGSGPVILICHEGFDDGSSYAAVARLLARKYRVLRFCRRPYRTDLPDGADRSVAAQVSDIEAIVDAVPGEPIIVGHSSGGNLALEALAAMPGRFSGGILYEPCLAPALDPVPTQAAKDAFLSGHVDEAWRTFFRANIGNSSLYTWLFSSCLIWPHYRRLVEGLVLFDGAGIEARGDRRAVFFTITAPVGFIGGAMSPPRHAAWIDELAGRLKHVERVTISAVGHNAHYFRPFTLARLIDQFALKCLG